MISSKLIDISLPIHPSMPVWPGSVEVGITLQQDLEQGDVVTESILHFSTHTGTHIDAPSHFLPNGREIHEIPLEQMNGPVYVADFSDRGVITAMDLERHSLSDNVSRILIKTANSKLWANGESRFTTDYVALSADAAQWLVDRHFQLVGIDYLSIQLFYDGPETHYILLGADVVVVEGLNLSGVQAGYYELICLPMRLMGTEGAPARVLLSMTNE
jgi:arylformamidase